MGLEGKQYNFRVVSKFACPRPPSPDRAGGNQLQSALLGLFTALVSAFGVA
jgi:hypothetical protein